MRLILSSVAVFAASFIVATFAAVPTLRAEFPKPSPYPKSWELDFEHGKPKRVVVDGRAYWYMTYQVTNNSQQEQPFLPAFELVTEDGRIVRNDIRIPKAAFDKVKSLEGNKYIEPAALIAGELRIGPDQAKDGVAIWPEPSPEMGQFQIYVSGLSGEIAQVKTAAATQPTILHKTLQLNYLVRGDEVYPGEDEVNENPQQWVMR
jgi:hypothetical protein